MKLIKNILTLALALLIYAGAKAQIADPIVLVNQLPSEIEETSGLIFINGKLWTHNDSGGEPILYSIDTTTGAVIERKVIAGVTNNDWEDIAKDQTHLYIGNFGAVSHNLQVLRIKIEDLENPNLDTIVPRIINFTYGTDGYPEEHFSATATRFDCEAMIVKDDTIFLFSKNWIDHTTYLYALPNKANFFHTISPVDSLTLDYLVTGADYDYATNTVALCGYTYNTANLDAYPHFTILSNFEGNKFLRGTQTNKAISGLTNIGIQVEGITFRDSNRLWVSNEKATKGVITIQPKLRELNITGFPIINEGQPQAYPEEPMPIDINFMVSDSIALINQSITFNDLSTMQPTEWHWDFGDGTSSTEQNPTHAYTAAGTYSITLNAKNEFSDETKTIENMIKINDPTFVNFNQNSSVANVHPNPASETITISNPDDNFSFEIFDASGKLIMKSHKKTFNGTTIDISFLNAGSYIVKINSDKGKREIKFIKI